MTELERMAIDFRTVVRSKAGLSTDWDKASQGMKEFYMELARRSMQSGTNRNKE